MSGTSTNPIRYQIGVDIGGTFTDLVMLGSDGILHTRKFFSTPDDYGRGIVEGIQAVMDDLHVEPDRIDRVVHATTVATNCILEQKGAKVGLLTTEGFRDVLEMRRLRIPEMYALNYPRPEPLVPRHLRLEVSERIGPQGQVWTPLDEDGVRQAAQKFIEADVESVAVSLLNAYVSGQHEKRAAEILRETLPKDVFITSSYQVLPVIREYERTSTTVINAYLGPILSRYFASIQQHLKKIGVDVPVQVMKSDGGLMSIEKASAEPAYLIESGPAAGVIGAARLGELMQLSDNISFDMGGTTAKASMVEDGDVSRTADYEVGAGINLSSKLVMGGGYALKLPVIDISEIGAGGGSLAAVDEGGLLRVGPQSAGSSPGPVAYNLGGMDPTFTDAVITLGYLNPNHLTGGRIKLDAAKAKQVLQERIADPLNSTLVEAAYGIYEVACSTMTRAIKAISTYRGRDPRDFALLAFGGNGPVVGAQLAELLEMRRVVIPPNPGVYSALGLLMANIEHEVASSYIRTLHDLDNDEINRRYREMEEELDQTMNREAITEGELSYVRIAEMRYLGQAHELAVTIPPEPSGSVTIQSMAKAFTEEHRRTYGHAADESEIQCVTLRVIARLQKQEADWAEVLVKGIKANGSQPVTRDAYFGARHGIINTPVVSRSELSTPRLGPLIIEEYDSTVVVPPGWTGQVRDCGSIHLEAEH